MQERKRELLRRFIESETTALHGILRAYLVRMGAVTAPSADQAATELLSDVVVEALRHAERFDSERGAMAWLLGIGLNLIRGRRRREPREMAVRDLLPDTDLSDDELFERFGGASLGLPEANRLDDLLAGVSADDRRVIELAVLNELDAEVVGHELGISAGAARVRLHRALRRLRVRLEESERDRE